MDADVTTRSFCGWQAALRLIPCVCGLFEAILPAVLNAGRYGHQPVHQNHVDVAILPEIFGISTYSVSGRNFSLGQCFLLPVYNFPMILVQAGSLFKALSTPMTVILLYRKFS